MWLYQAKCALVLINLNKNLIEFRNFVDKYMLLKKNIAKFNGIKIKAAHKPRDIS